jgi:uncharacterized protein YxjI
MPKYLSVANKLLSFRGAITFTDEHDKTVFDAKGGFAFFSPTWRLKRGDQELAAIRKKRLTWVPKWEVKSVLGNFVIKRRVWAITRKYDVIGGRLDGAAIRGSLFDFNAEILVRDRPIAKAYAKMLTLRDRYNVEVLDQSEDSLTFTAIAMVVMLLDKKAEARISGDASD